MAERAYIAIDLKSFYASVECMERGLDPMTTNLVVADESRTEKTICLAVSPSLKSYGISGRARLFEVIQRVGEVNRERKSLAPGGVVLGESWDDRELRGHPEIAVSYLVAPPQMAKYMQRSAEIYKTYLKYIAPEDIHVYSIDEVFIDATDYLKTYGKTARELAMTMIRDVLRTTGITATAGIGTNLYLAKIAMDVMAKKMKPDQDGVRIAQLDEMSYRRELWDHTPITAFWRVGKGYAKKLAAWGVHTMGDVARCSLENEELLYRLFGVNAELLIDHAWGWEPCTMADIKSYQPETNSAGSGQVLRRPYSFEEARLVVREMADLLALDLVKKKLVTDQVVLTVGYDIENLTDPKRKKAYKGPVTTDPYGRKIPKHAHGSENLSRRTSSAKLLTQAVLTVYDRVADPCLLVRRLNLTAARVVEETAAAAEGEQLDLFTDYTALEERRQEEEAQLRRERRQQEAVLAIKGKFGKNAILKGMDLEETATTVERNNQIGGHKA